MSGRSLSTVFLGVCLLLAAFIISSGAESKNRVVFLANSVDGALAGDFIGFLGNQGVEVLRVNASEFRDVSGEEFIIILGGQNAPEGVGSIVGEVLDGREQEGLLSSNASRSMFVKASVWREGQVVRVFAGYEREQTRLAWVDNQDLVARALGSTSTTLGVSGGCDGFCRSAGYSAGVCRINPAACRTRGSGEVYKQLGDRYCVYRSGHEDTCCCVV